MAMDSKKSSKPFYALPEKTPTSSQIINAARSSLRTFDTRRPNTPRDEQRHLFPSSTTRAPESRPPSSFSLTSRHFDGPDSRPVSGTRLSPLDHHPKPVNQADLENILVPRPPADPSKGSQRRGSANRARVPSAISLDGTEQVSRSGYGDEASAADTAREKAYTETARGSGDQCLPDGAERAPGGIAAPSSAGSDGRSGSAGSRKSSAGKSSRTSSAGKRDAEDFEEIYTLEIEPLVTEMASLTKKKDCDRMYELASQLYTTLECRNCLTRQFQHRSNILKIIFKLLDVDEPRVLLRMARLILAFKVTGNNLLNVCKLVFKVSRNDKNDSFFLEENILNLLLDTIRSSDPSSSCEALIYCVGAVKFLTGNPNILKRLAKLDCVKTLATLMHSINKINRENGKTYDQYGHILVQLAAALRNLADTSSGRDRFLTHHVIDGLVTLMDTYPGDSDLMLYISRILSKITLHTDCCSVLANQHSCYRAFVNLLKQHLLKDDLVVRLCFVLGNLTIKNDSARLKLFQEIDSIETLLNILKTYCELDRQGKTSASGDGEESQLNGGVDGESETEVNKVEDVLIKVMRVLANLSVNEDVGPAIAANPDFVELLISVVEDKDVAHHEEVVVNAVVAVNNVSYYTTQDPSQMTAHLKMAESLLKLIMIDNTEGILEAARVFGNLTRHKQIRDFLSQNKVDAMMITLLDSGNREIVYIACGVLINFMLDEDKRSILKKEGGIQKLTDVLRDFGREDWQLSGCVCKVLVNYSSRIHSSSNSFGNEESAELSELLAEYLDKDCALSQALASAADEEMREYIEDTWQEEFCPVGSQLLKRIESYSSPLEPLEAPS
ncbi:armadillo repeat-containing protein 2 isoform X2 [Aplysia californica]|uniref:Armadillo repeat-containing protein 2 isoform X2 n=1 Tax=Aplysia californica TaxID=6500 RepID=A0ABM0JUY6_APLCA|nr:armadillo repeat-containing protein 2 isoform X2 [Aplysia californica]